MNNKTTYSRILQGFAILLITGFVLLASVVVPAAMPYAFNPAQLVAVRLLGVLVFAVFILARVKAHAKALRGVFAAIMLTFFLAGLLASCSPRVTCPTYAGTGKSHSFYAQGKKVRR